MLLSDFRTQVAAIIGMDNVTTTGPERALIDVWVNEGVTDVLLRTRCRIRPSEPVTLSIGYGDYQVLDALRIMEASVTASGTSTRLYERSAVEILDLRRGSTSAPARYYAFEGGDMLMLAPLPAAADTLSFYFVPRPAVLSSATASPDEIPAEYHHVVRDYALWRCADYDDDSTSQNGERYRQQYEKGLQEMRRYLVLKGGRLSPARIPGNSRYGNNRYTQAPDQIGV